MPLPRPGEVPVSRVIAVSLTTFSWGLYQKPWRSPKTQAQPLVGRLGCHFHKLKQISCAGFTAHEAMLGAEEKIVVRQVPRNFSFYVPLHEFSADGCQGYGSVVARVRF